MRSPPEARRFYSDTVCVFHPDITHHGHVRRVRWPQVLDKSVCYLLRLSAIVVYVQYVHVALHGGRGYQYADEII